MCSGVKCVFKLLKYSVGVAGSSLSAVKRCLYSSMKESNDAGINSVGTLNSTILKPYVRCNAGHNRVWRATLICRRDHSGHTMQGFILAPPPSDWFNDP